MLPNSRMPSLTPGMMVPVSHSGPCRGASASPRVINRPTFGYVRMNSAMQYRVYSLTNGFGVLCWNGIPRALASACEMWML